MQFSINEIEALLSKAARGGGAPAGQASTFGKAAALHLARGCDVDDVQIALRALPDGPIILCPVDLHAALANGGGAMPCNGHELLCSYAMALPYLVTQTDSGVTIDMHQYDKPKLPARLSIEAGVIDAWKALAALTYVPETEQSRQAGAGAGLTDND